MRTIQLSCEHWNLKISVWFLLPFNISFLILCWFQNFHICLHLNVNILILGVLQNCFFLCFCTGFYSHHNWSTHFVCNNWLLINWRSWALCMAYFCRQCVLTVHLVMSCFVQFFLHLQHTLLKWVCTGEVYFCFVFHCICILYCRF